MIRRRTDNAQWRTRRARRLREWHLAENPWCVDCLRAGRHRPASEVHHRVSQIDAPHLVLAAGNLVGLCAACHLRRHSAGGGGAKT